ncbi:MAG: CRTAC1 family protein [Acidobacteria bacterium]|nr:CRTAC1 family protein [Acidobacteriota bacterium]
MISGVSVRIAVTGCAAFVGLIALAQGVATRNAPPAPKTAPSGRPFLASFEDVAVRAGLTAPTLFGNSLTKRYIIEANGAGLAAIDYDNDGWLDLFVPNGSRLEGFGATVAPTSRLYRNTGKGSFTDVTVKAGAALAGWGSGACAGDFDNDGDDDLYVTYWGPNALLVNSGSGEFSEQAARRGVAGPAKEWSSGCTFLDYDRDGKLDLFVTSYQQFDPATTPPPGKSSNCEWKGMPVFCGPRGLPFGRATLYRQLPNGSFEDVSNAAGISKARDFYAFTAVAADFNGDGWTDIYIASDSTPSLLFRNQKNGTFREIGTETGVAFNEHGFEQGGMGIGVGDYNRDGRLDIVKTNFAGDHPNLYRNTGGGIFEDTVLSAGLGINPQFVGWGVALADLDNDGWQDILQVNGHVYPELKDGPGEFYRQTRVIYRNLGDGKFEDVSGLAGPAIGARHSSRGAAFGDFDNDGDIDVAVLNMGERPSLLLNTHRGSAHWIRIELEGVASNRSAIGAVVTIESAGGKQTQAVLSQSSFLSQNDRRLHFGLGTANKVDRIIVAWLTGVTETFPAHAANATVRLKEGSSGTRP